MDARKLLENIEARGGVATVKRDGDAAILNVSPRSLALELLPELQRFKPALLELLTQAPGDGDGDALALLAKYRRGGALLALEVVEHAGALWLALACDLTDVPKAKRERAFEQMERNAKALRRALELEAARREVTE